MEPPLFERAQLERMRQARRDHPLIYGQASEVGSDNSSRLQAEVQRQLEEYADIKFGVYRMKFRG